MKLKQRIMAFLLTTIMVGSNLLGLGSQVIATVPELEKQNSKTNHNNVEFNSCFEEGSYHKQVKVGEEVYLNLSFEVKNGGYLRNGMVQLSEGNYKIDSGKVENEKIESSTSNQIKIKQIASQEGKVTFSVPIQLEEKETVSQNYFSSQTKVTFTATYVDNNGKEKAIKKEIQNQVIWKVEPEVEINLDFTKLVPYQREETYGVMLQTKLTSKLKENSIPVESMQLLATAPTFLVENKKIKPTRATVVANTTAQTNGKDNGIEFGEANYQYEDGKVTIEVQNEEKRSWKKNTQDEFLITYLYEGKDVYEWIKKVSQEETPINLEAVARYIVDDEVKKPVEKAIQKDFQLEEKGKINDYELETTKEISKGYLYANEVAKEKLETNYQQIYRTKIYDRQLVENISFIPMQEKLVGEKTYKANTIVKEVLIPVSIFHKLLGEEGKIEILENQKEIIGEITSQTQKDEANNYILDLTDKKIETISIKTSKPIAEGEFALRVTKALTTSQTISKSQLKEIYKMTLGVKADDTKELSAEINLKEPVTKAELIIDETKQNLSTVMENKDVEMKIVLDTLNTDSSLYKNPTFEIELPSYIEKVNVKDISLLLEDELKIKEAKQGKKNGKIVIQITLEGAQTKYFQTNANQEIEEKQNIITKGANIVIRADITVKKLAPSKTETINLYYTNENTNLYEKTVEQTQNTKAKKVRSSAKQEAVGIATAKVNIVAPSGVTTAVTMSGYDEKGSELSSITNDKQEAIIPINSKAKTLTITGTVINNYENHIGDLVILGRIPSKDNQKIDTAESLGSNFDTKLLTDISVTGVDSSKITVYYSENANATKDLSNSNNGWKNGLVSLSNIKSYLIVINPDTDLEKTNQIEFEYQVEVPANLKTSQNSFGMYKIYYTNKAQVATMQETKTSAIIGVTTGDGPELEAKLTASMEENQIVRVGQYIRFYVEVKNIGKVDANQVQVIVPLPEKIAKQVNGKDQKYEENAIIFADYEEYNGNFTNLKDTHKTITIPSIKVGETKKVDYHLFIKEASNIQSIKNKVEVTADKLNGNITSNEYVLPIADGNLIVENKVSTVEESIYRPGDEITYKIRLANYSFEDIKNIVVNVPIPRNATVLESNLVDKDKNKVEAEITNKDSQLIAKIEELTQEVQTVILEVKFKLGEKVEEKFSTKVQVTINNNETYYSNERFVYLTANIEFTVEQLQPSKLDIKESEEFEYLFSVQTKGEDVVRNFILEDILPEGVTLLGSTVEVIEKPEEFLNGAYAASQTNQIATFRMDTIAPNAKILIKLKVKARLPDNSKEEKELINRAEVYADGTEKTAINSVTMYLQYNDEVHEPDSSNPNENPGVNSYIISGTAWIDENQNGEREEQEELLAGVEVMLIHKENSQIVLDKNTNQPKIATTKADGTYSFNQISPGQYMVIFLYDAGKYNITDYQKEGVNVNTNNDAISMKITLDGEKIVAGVTNTIRITNSSQRNIDLGVYVQEKFDLRLDKYISKVTRNTPTIGTDVTEYHNQKVGKVEVLARNVGKSSTIVEYKIVVTNEGGVPGYVKKIVDYLPEGTKFSSELNKDWYISDNNRTVYNNSLESILINPGESKEVSLILSMQITQNNIGTVINNTAEIYESYNDKGLKDIDSTEANMLQGEDDMSQADIVLSIVTGKIILYTTFFVGILAIVVISIIVIKKKVLPKKI